MTHEAVEMSPLVAVPDTADMVFAGSSSVLRLYLYLGHKPNSGRHHDGEIAKIRDELERAKTPCRSRRHVLGGLSRPPKEAIKEAEAIIAHARDRSVRLRLKPPDLDSLKRRERSAMQRILVAENERRWRKSGKPSSIKPSRGADGHGGPSGRRRS